MPSVIPKSFQNQLEIDKTFNTNEARSAVN